MHFPFSRRSFLKASLLGSLALCVSNPAWASLAEEFAAPGRLNLYNTHTGEKLRLTFRDYSGHYDEQALEALNWFFRCHYTNRQCDMDVDTLEYLNLVDQRLGRGNEIHIISAYRSPEYNKFLLNQGRRVAKKSLHLEGRALDIRIPKIPTSDIRQAALRLQLGGVGYYPGSDFVHIDSGDFRTW
ncbi:YcbK family protein [Thiovibrio sp. JS02]